MKHISDNSCFETLSSRLAYAAHELSFVSFWKYTHTQRGRERELSTQHFRRKGRNRQNNFVPALPLLVRCADEKNRQTAIGYYRRKWYKLESLQSVTFVSLQPRTRGSIGAMLDFQQSIILFLTITIAFILTNNGMNIIALAIETLITYQSMANC